MGMRDPETAHRFLVAVFWLWIGLVALFTAAFTTSLMRPQPQKRPGEDFIRYEEIQRTERTGRIVDGLQTALARLAALDLIVFIAVFVTGWVKSDLFWYEVAWPWVLLALVPAIAFVALTSEHDSEHRKWWKITDWAKLSRHRHGDHHGHH
ncbi:MAG TPA: hypothetical protein VLF69_02030 [Candidatus Saccharimonadales bacterium]|nr:hypothetical protein [Candidatus Saccharimonadales bacterium]